MTIGSLINQISDKSLRLPEIQRGYVWKPAQVAGLIDSLYRRYPSGSILLWETVERVEEKDVSSTPTGGVALMKPLYLLDGQQRLTSLHRVFTDHARAQVVFNVVTEKFQIESAATKKDQRWIKVYDVLADDADLFGLVTELRPVVEDAGFTQDELFKRLNQIRQISNYPYWLEILENLPYPEVTEIFVRVNSRGRALKDTDLALSTLSARWPGVVAKLEAETEWAKSRHYQALDMAFLVRCLAALATDTTSPGSFANAPIERLETGWTATKRGVRHTVALLQDGVEIDNSALIPSANALVPLVFHLGSRPDAPLLTEERNALIYWLLVAFIQSRFSASAATVIAQDVAALRSDEPLPNLYRNLGLLKQRPEIMPSTLAGKSSTSPYFLLSYLAARQRKARDWWYGVPVGLSHDGSYSVEYHHIHPRATLKDTYSKAEINDLANLAFISDKANRKISARRPADYFPELDADDLERHFVPLNPEVRTMARFPEFIAERRRALAEAMNTLLESYRPSMLNDVTPGDEVGNSAALAIEVYGASAADARLVFIAVCGAQTWTDSVPYMSFTAALDDLADGVGTEIAFVGGTINVPAETVEVSVPMGPLLVEGSPDDWRKVLLRELDDLSPIDKAPSTVSPPEWQGDRVRVSVLDAD